MINLIPPAAKKSLLLEYWIRVASVWLLLWMLALCMSASIMLPTYVLIGSQVAVYEESAAAASEKVAVYENVSVSLRAASEQARYAIDTSRLVVFSDLITRFQGLQGDTIGLTQITLSREGTDVAPIIIKGIADDRQALASFRDRLLAEASVVAVDLPISNLAQDREIAFTLTVELAANPTDV